MFVFLQDIVKIVLHYYLKGAVSRNSDLLGNYKMPVKLRETKITA